MRPAICLLVFLSLAAALALRVQAGEGGIPGEAGGADIAPGAGKADVSAGVKKPRLPARALRLPALFGGPFRLTDETGKRVGPETYAGRFMLIYFGYSWCPDICPTDLTVMAEALDGLGPLAERVQPLLVSVDPVRDTAESLAAFTDAFHPALVGLTGTEAEVAAAARAYRVHRRIFRMEDTPEGEYLVDHSTLTYLMGPDGAFVTMFPRGTSPDRMSEVLAKYLAG